MMLAIADGAREVWDAIASPAACGLRKWRQHLFRQVLARHLVFLHDHEISERKD